MTVTKEITEKKLNALRASVADEMSAKRFCHTLGVEREIERLSDIYCPSKVMLLRAAALLHDITKEYSIEEHKKVMERYGADTSDMRAENSKLFHSLTASMLIPDKYPEYADPEIICAVRVHTTGCADMSLFDKLLYLADYIEDTRTFEDCVALRRFFYDGIEKGCERLEHLDRTLIMSFDMTLQDLIARGKTISHNTLEARNSLLIKGV